jgi:NAD(P)-dependent dehydrogenase (short-subunit alcohol dehydrogenase family)
MPELLENRVAVLVGVGTAGEPLSNGRATALEFMREGARLILVDRDAQVLNDCAAAIEAEGGKSHTHQVDATDEAQVKQLFESCVSEYGRVDILHNNLGITSFGKVGRVTSQDFDKLVSVNLKAVFLLCKYALEIMEQQNSGVITNISSISSIRHLGIRSPLYDMTKAGVNALTRSIAVDYGPKNIRANAILVGMMDTPLARGGISDAGRSPEKVYENYIQRIPVQRMGRGTDTAHLAAFLASDHAAYINGAEIVIDGGLTVQSA